MYSIIAPAQMHMGPGSLAALKEVASGFGTGRILIVTDEGIRAAGILDEVLKAGEIDPGRLDIFDSVQASPEIPLLEACGEKVAAGGYALVIGVGGGSSLDVAKAASVLPANGGKMRPILGRGMVKNKGVPLCLIPTTSGTGSEVTQAVVTGDPEKQTKVSIWDPHVIPRYAIIDPVLASGMPPGLTADTGLDAVAHAVEAYTVKPANPVSRLYAKEVLQLAAKSLPVAVRDGRNMEARAAMSLAATLAGLAFSNSGLGAIHAFCLPLESRKHLPHGRSVAIVSPWIADFNRIGNEETFAAIAGFLGEDISGLDAPAASKKASAGLKKLMESVGVSPYLKDHGIADEEVDGIAKEAFQVGQRLLPFNPREVSEDDAIAIFRASAHR
jgi:alcohol dehydrogenase class IV